MIVDTLNHWRDYFNGPVWEKVFHYLEGLSASTEVADKVHLQGEEVFARVMRYPTRGPEDGMLEAHNRYIDVQMSLSGGEGVDWFPRSSLKATGPFDEANDVILFKRPSGHAAARIENRPGVFTVLFPEDAHMAQQVLDGSAAEVLKVVVKVRLDLVRGA